MNLYFLLKLLLGNNRPFSEQQSRNMLRARMRGSGPVLLCSLCLWLNFALFRTGFSVLGCNGLKIESSRYGESTRWLDLYDGLLCCQWQRCCHEM